MEPEELPPNIDEKDLIVGKTYEVESEDCCTSVYFTSKLLEITRNDDYDKYVTTWENGVKLDAKKTYCILIGE